jgi:hypothetical protein
VAAGAILARATGTVRSKSSRTHFPAWTQLDEGVSDLGVIMNPTGYTTFKPAIGSSGLSAFVVSAVHGAPRGF